MKLLTKSILQKLPRLYSTENTPLEGKTAVCKFFTPDSNWTWYALEGEKQKDGDFLFFGWVVGLEKEFGYFSLRELESARGPLGLPIERDLCFGPKPLKKVMDFHGETL
ncbi:MAG: DUF2958 domain-containing protein [Synergistales bacterium]